MCKPSKKTIQNLNRIAKILNNLEMETYWVDELSQKYRLTMDDLKPGMWVFQPQIYDEVEEIDPEQFEYFYEHNGDAVTGSGADTWGLYRPGILNEMTNLVKKYS